MLKTTGHTVNISNSIKEETECCRMCLEKTGEFINLESTFEYLSADLSYWDAYNSCTNLNALPTDHLPTIICVDCAGNLQFVFNILKRAEHSDQVLRQFLDKQMVIEEFRQDYEELDDEEVINNLSEADDGCADNEIEELIYLDEDIRQSEDDETSSQNAFRCDFCEDIFFTERSYAQHLPTHNKYEPIETTTAGDLLKEPPKESLKKLSTNCVICEICGKSLSTKQKLKMHHFTHTKEKNFPCNLCPKRYTTIFLRRVHMRSHANIRPHECTFCNQKFFSKAALVCHLRRHTGERPYKCEICGKTFNQSSIMKTHAALHTGKTVECPHCFKKFSRPSHLILHQRSHTGERPYVCHLCPNTYKQKSHLDRHLDTHMGVKHTCAICGKEYTKKSTLNTHMYVHAGKKPFKCDICSMEFVFKNKYQRHLKIRHKTTNLPDPTNGPDCTLDNMNETKPEILS